MPDYWRSWPVADKIKLRDELRRRAAVQATSDTTPAFENWLRVVSPDYTWDWDYQRHIISKLRVMQTGGKRRLMLFLPPRHGKSEMVTVRYSAWSLERDPRTRVAIAAYGQTLAEKFSRKVRSLVRTRMTISDERTASADWETGSGGGLRAVGVGGGITGQGVDLLIIDDPVKSRAEAESLAYRDRVWDWYTDDLFTRQEPGARIVLIMTRWHEDDLAGRILMSDDAPNWEVISLPAEAEAGDPIGREVGAPLCPDRYDLDALAERRSVLGRSYYALFQQRPMPAEGGMFQRSWFDLVDAVPANANRVRYWDKAGTDGDGDYTVGLLMAEAHGDYYVEDIVRGQWSSGERDRIMRQTAALDAQKYGQDLVKIDDDGFVLTEKAKGVTQWIEQEPGSGGKESATATVRNLAGFNVRVECVSGSKAIRAEPVAAQAEAGNVHVLRASWTGAYIDELASFPMGAHDDQVDTTSGAFNHLAIKGGVSRAPSLYD